MKGAGEQCTLALFQDSYKIEVLSRASGPKDKVVRLVVRFRQAPPPVRVPHSWMAAVQWQRFVVIARDGWQAERVKKLGKKKYLKDFFRGTFLHVLLHTNQACLASET